MYVCLYVCMYVCMYISLSIYIYIDWLRLSIHVSKRSVRGSAPRQSHCPTDLWCEAPSGSKRNAHIVPSRPKTFSLFRFGMYKCIYKFCNVVDDSRNE